VYVCIWVGMGARLRVHDTHVYVCMTYVYVCMTQVGTLKHVCKVCVCVCVCVCMCVYVCVCAHQF